MPCMYPRVRLSFEAYAEIRAKLIAAGCQRMVMEVGGREHLDLYGIALEPEPPLAREGEPGHGQDRPH